MQPEQASAAPGWHIAAAVVPPLVPSSVPPVVPVVDPSPPSLELPVEVAAEVVPSAAPEPALVASPADSGPGSVLVATPGPSSSAVDTRPLVVDGPVDDSVASEVPAAYGEPQPSTATSPTTPPHD